MIVVTGASGVLGRAVVGRLLERIAPEQIVASVRDPAAVDDLAARGVRVRRGDYADPDSLRSAFAGADRVLVVSGAAPGEAGVAQHVAAIDAARNAGAQRVYYTSHQAAAADSLFGPALIHAATEDALVASGVAWTSLRNGFYANSPLYLVGDARESGHLRTPADGPVSWTTRDDLAAGAAALLVTEQPPDGPVTLTGPETATFADVASTLSTLFDRDVEHVVVDDEQWVADCGVPEPQARLFLTLFTAARRGEFDVVDPTLERLIGRRPDTVRDALASALG